MNDDLPFSFDLIMYPHLMLNRLSDYGGFYTDIEHAFKKFDEDLQAEISERLKEIPEADHDEFFEGYSYDFHQNQLMFPSMHRASTFITLYNFFEYSLNQLCKSIGDELGSRIGLQDLKGSGIERAFLFLDKVPEFAFSSIENHMSFIRYCNKLRNVIVHNGGVLPEDRNDPLNRFVNSTELLRGGPGREVLFEHSFVPAFIDSLEAFFETVQNEMQRFLDKFRS